jgi:hypothetical protein
VEEGGVMTLFAGGGDAGCGGGAAFGVAGCEGGGAMVVGAGLGSGAALG